MSVIRIKLESFTILCQITGWSPADVSRAVVIKLRSEAPQKTNRGRL